MSKGGTPSGNSGMAPVEAEDRALFRAATQDVKPITPHGRILPPPPRIPPVPLSRLRDERQAILESLHDPIRWDEEIGGADELAFVRPGLSRQTLRRLRRGDWIAQAELDLHGLTRIQAKQELAEFLHECKRRGVRCAHIVHGKGLGSPNREPVLKYHVRHWLTRREEILAFVQARPVDGGAGAVMVLLKSANY